MREDHVNSLKRENNARIDLGKTPRKWVCIICAQPSDAMICGACADKIGADALEKKRWDEKGKP
jgi:hypothetical protein